MPGRMQQTTDQKTLAETVIAIAKSAKVAARKLAYLPSAVKNAALLEMAVALCADQEVILAENARDIVAAEQQGGLNPAGLDRLRLTPLRIAVLVEGIRSVAQLEDPIGKVIQEWTRPNGLRISKVRTPIGVIGVVYESRPNVTSDAGVLCIKTGNASVLRGGSESIRSNLAIVKALQSAASRAGLPVGALSIIPFTNREAIEILAGLDSSIDLMIPRGGAGLIETVMRYARMPVLKHSHGVCQVYVDKDADLTMAEAIVVNAKCQRPGVCNALETLLIHQEIAPEFLRRVGRTLEKKGVEIRGDPTTQQILASRPATEEDWSTEYLDLILAVRVVENFEAALEHIDRYGSHHSDTIVTTHTKTAERFLQEVDSATVYWNASTRFTDGSEFGFGAEIGISTDKLHARGPMGLAELTSYKYIIRGSGQIRE